MALPAWMDAAWSELGQREREGSTDNPRITAFYRDVGHGEAVHDEVAWCAAFVGACLERAGIASTRSLLARSYVDWGEAHSDHAMPGAIAVFSRGGDPAKGHVAFHLDSDAAHVYVLGGNQSDAVTVTAISRERLLALRWPSQPAVDSGDQSHPAARPAIAAPFEVALAHVLAMEGGWTEDPYDPGGPTNYGITLATLAAHRRLVLDSGNFSSLRQQLKQISATDVRDIYLGRYWQPCRARLLSPALAVMHFDAAVNHGVAAAARMLQEAAGVEIDGDIGPQTLAATRAADGQALIRRYADIRRARYRALPHFWRFGRGWLNRVEATVKLCTTQSTSQPDGDDQMTDLQENYPPTTTPVAPPSPRKWWGESMTVWGALITAAATVVPALGPVIGIDITGEMVRQVGTHGIEAVQALGGLFGTLMTIYGRFRATTRIGLRSVTVQV